MSFTEHDGVRGIANCTFVKGGGAGGRRPLSGINREVPHARPWNGGDSWVFARSPGMADSMRKYILWCGCDLQLHCMDYEPVYTDQLVFTWYTTISHTHAVPAPV